MTSRHRIRTLLLVAASLVFWGPVAHAADVCVQSYVAGQKLRAGNKLLESQTKLQLCAEARCPTAIVKDCSTWLNEVTAAIPRLSIAALGHDGNETLDVSVEVDGVSVAARLGTKPLLLDPGKHKLRLTHQGKTLEKSIIAQQGMRRTLDISFAEAKRPPPVADRGHPIAGYVIGLIGLGGLTVSAVYGIPFLRDLNTYNDAVKTKNDACGGGDDALCTSTPDPDPAPNKSHGIVADVSGIVGGAALALGGGLIIYHYASGPSDDEDEDEAAKDGKHGFPFRPMVGIAPMPGGAFGTVQLSF